jgi:sterol desaturase/sphingolipid hydroxylase (fatty acid hydroxylase superfamily)
MFALVTNAVFPLAVFVALAWNDRRAPNRQPIVVWDVALNLIGFLMQGAIVPGLGYVVSLALLPAVWPAANGLLGLGFASGFLLNFVAVDFLYYWQHRFFHNPRLWPLHRCHHASGRVDVWATARNSLVTNFLFVYLLVNPILAYLCGSRDGFIVGAALTAALDLVRHSRLETPRWVAFVLVTPQLHHMHHDASAPPANFGANFSIWDRLFGTARFDHEWPACCAAPDAPSPPSQLFYPIPIRPKRIFDHAPGPGATAAQEHS